MLAHHLVPDLRPAASGPTSASVRAGIRYTDLMLTVDEILEAARRLPESERRRLIQALQDKAREVPLEQQRREAMSKWLALAGAFHSDFTDVSTEKYKHLADVYFDER